MHFKTEIFKISIECKIFQENGSGIPWFVYNSQKTITQQQTKKHVLFPVLPCLPPWFYWWWQLGTFKGSQIRHVVNVTALPTSLCLWLLGMRPKLRELPLHTHSHATPGIGEHLGVNWAGHLGANITQIWQWHFVLCLGGGRSGR